MTTVQIVDCTTNYGQFRFDPGNRPIDFGRLSMLIESIKSNNLLAYKPINVTADGLVLDGQYRLEAARALKKPIYYIISDRMSMRDVPAINSTQTSWSKSDYLNLYCAQGIDDYLFVRSLWQEYPRHQLSTLIGLLMFGDRSALKRQWETGQFKATRRHYARAVLGAMNDFAPLISWYNSQSFVFAIATLFDHKEYSHERMLRKVRRQSAKLTRQVSVASYLPLLAAIYNYGEPEDRHLIFKMRDHIGVTKRFVYPEPTQPGLAS